MPDGTSNVTPEAAAALPPTSRVILAAGMPRSGSTAIFNLGRLLLEGDGRPLTSGWIDDVTDPVQSTVLLKLHEWNPALARRADVVLTCHRDLRAVARSLAAVGWLWPGARGLDHIDHIVRLHTRWSAVATLDLCYEAMVGDWVTAAAAVASALGVDAAAADVATAARRVAELRPEIPADREYDPVTLMHRNHRRQQRSGSPPLRIEEEIQRRFSVWQEAHGYL